MAEYLLPNNKELSILEKQTMFAVRNKMIFIPANFSNGNTEHLCYCGNTETMEHIYQCKILNNEEDQTSKYENIYNGNIKQQTKVFQIFETNINRRERMKTHLSLL